MNESVTANNNPFVSRLRRLTPLGDAELSLIDELLRERRSILCGRDFVKAGASGDKLHILLAGWACRYKILQSGKRQITALVLPGDPCDLDGILVGRQDSSVSTLTDIQVAVVSRDALLSVGRKYPRLADLLLWLTTLDNAAMSERLASVGRRPARERVAHLLCELMLRLGFQGSSGESYSLPLTQEAIGDTLGLTAVHVNRTLRSLRTEGTIELEGRMLIVKNWPSLKAIAGFDPGYLHLSGMRDVPFERER